jgi:predicted nucleotidyltransferase
MFIVREPIMVTPNDVLPPLLDEIRSRLTPFCQSHGIARSEVFGSLARGESNPGGDIDLLVTSQPHVPLGRDFFERHKEIEDIIGCGG